jgi:hypothetical protein
MGGSPWARASARSRARDWCVSAITAPAPDASCEVLRRGQEGLVGGVISLPPKGFGRYRDGSSVTPPTIPTRTARVPSPCTTSA